MKASYGWIPDLPDHRDRGSGGRPCAPGPAVLPPHVDLRPRLPAGVRPGPARELHGQRDRRRDRVRADEARAAQLGAVAAVHLLQRAGDGGHGRQRLRRPDPRRDQERRHAGRLPRDRMAVRPSQFAVAPPAAVLRRRDCTTRSTSTCPWPRTWPTCGPAWPPATRSCSGSRCTRASSRPRSPRPAGPDAGPVRADRRRSRRAGRRVRRPECDVHRAELVGAGWGDGGLLHSAVRVPDRTRTWPTISGRSGWCTDDHSWQCPAGRSYPLHRAKLPPPPARPRARPYPRRPGVHRCRRGLRPTSLPTSRDRPSRTGR